MRALFAVALAMGGLGCAQVSLEASFVADHHLTYDVASYPDDAAVELFAEDGTLIIYRRTRPSYTQRLFHRVYAVQAESAYDLAEHRIALYGKQKLVALRARHKAPDGTLTELDPRSVIAEEGPPGEENVVHGKVFRIPNVERGSIIEWSYVVEYPYLDTDSESEPMGEYPIKRYEAWIEATKEIILEGRIYNIPVRTQTGLGRNAELRRIAAAMNDVPARPKNEQYAAQWTFTQPRWAYRMLRWNEQGLRTPVLETWNDVAGRWAVRGWSTLKGQPFEKFSENVDVAGCENVWCRVERARAFIHQRTSYRGLGEYSRVREATEILESREATAMERGVLLRRLIEDSGLTASLAAFTARHSAHFDKTFPTFERFNRLLVYLPPQKGLADGLWIDPACESCALGEVSSEASGVEALVYRANMIRLMDPDIVSEFRVVNAKAAADPVLRVTHRGQLAGGSQLHLDTVVERSARWAHARCGELRHQTAGHRFDDARREVLGIATSARLLQNRAFSCDDARGTAVEEREVLLPSAVVEDGDRRYVSLQMLFPGFVDTFAEEKRLQPIAIEGSGWSTEHLLKLELPAGWVLASGPQNATATAPGLKATVETTSAMGTAEVRITLTAQPGYYEATEYPAFKRLGDFVRNVRLGVVELRRK